MNPALVTLGLSTFFTRQLSVEEFENGHLSRIVQVQRSRVVASDGVDEWTVELTGPWHQSDADRRPTVGDWVLLDRSHQKIVRLLERKSVFKRMAPGSKVDVQIIAANVDTLFIVTSCNDEFAESRLERYLALALEAAVHPVVVLTKADQATDPEGYRARALSVMSDVPVELVNTLDANSLKKVAAWITKGSTVALVGSSGVGKSTIVNSLAGTQLTKTGAIRDSDAKGRHTTSHRELHLIPDGGLLLDVPGMRELKVAELGNALGEVFEDIEALATGCRFADCNHIHEPGCAVREAIGRGVLQERRLINYQKLVREEFRNTASLAEQRHRGRQLSKTIRQHTDLKRRGH